MRYYIYILTTVGSAESAQLGSILWAARDEYGAEIEFATAQEAVKDFLTFMYSIFQRESRNLSCDLCLNAEPYAQVKYCSNCGRALLSQYQHKMAYADWLTNLIGRQVNDWRYQGWQPAIITRTEGEPYIILCPFEKVAKKHVFGEELKFEFDKDYVLVE